MIASLEKGARKDRALRIAGHVTMAFGLVLWFGNRSKFFPTFPFAGIGKKVENEIVTRVGPGTPMGNTLRRYWVPALLSSEIPGPDCAPARVRLLGEDLVAFRDTDVRDAQ